MEPWAVHFCDHLFASILDLILDSSWVHFGLVLGAFWDPFGSPNPVKLGQKCVLNRHVFENDDVIKQAPTWKGTTQR